MSRPQQRGARHQTMKKSKSLDDLSLELAHQDTWDRWIQEGISKTGFETLDYAVGIGCVTLEDREREQVAYMVINKLTGVVEFSTSILPEAMANLRGLQSGLDQERGMVNAAPKLLKN